LKRIEEDWVKMKILHLADLHIGKTVRMFSMLEDQEYILTQILGLVRERRPDAVVIAGDVYDRPSPSAAAVRVFDRFLTELAREKTAVFVIGGNHDSPERLGFGGRIMSERNVHLCGPFEGEPQSVTLRDEYGEVRFYLLPFIRPSSVFQEASPDAASDTNPNTETSAGNREPRAETHHDAVKMALAPSLASFERETRNVLVAHQFVVASGGEPERSDSEIAPIGGADAVDASLFADFDYVALGHLHAPQKVGREEARYAGSPLKYSASECHRQKSVPLAELRGKDRGKCEVEVTLLPLTPLRDTRKIRGPLEELLKPDIVSRENSEDYLYVTLTDEDEVIDAMGKLRAAYPNVMALDYENRRSAAEPNFDGAAPTERPTSEIFKIFFREQNGREMNDEEMSIALGLLQEIGENSAIEKNARI
jgi:exonuclease SbcD